MTFSRKQKIEKGGIIFEKSIQEHPRNSNAERIENIGDLMPKWSRNPSKIHRKSIQESRSEKRRPTGGKGEPAWRPEMAGRRPRGAPGTPGVTKSHEKRGAEKGVGKKRIFGLIMERQARGGSGTAEGAGGPFLDYRIQEL